MSNRYRRAKPRYARQKLWIKRQHERKEKFAQIARRLAIKDELINDYQKP